MNHLKDRLALIATALAFGFIFFVVIRMANDAMGLEIGTLFKVLMTIGFACSIYLIFSNRKKR